MQIELSNGLSHVWQWDRDITVTVPEGVDSVHFRWGNKSVEISAGNRQVTIPPELMQKPGKIRLWTYTPEHTLDMADIPVQPKNKPSDYAYTPTEVRTWEQLDERITALEQGGGIAGVTSVNGKSGTVELTAEDVGAATAEDVTSAVNAAAETLQPKGDYITQDGLQSATDKALAQAKASGEFDGPQGPKGDAGDTGPQGPQGEPGADAVEDISLGLTGATVGQLIKVKAVDDNGVPTAWKAVDMPSGCKWEEINEFELPEPVNKLTIDMDSNQSGFALRAAMIECVIAVDTSDPFTYIKTSVNGFVSSPNATLSKNSAATRYYSCFIYQIPGSGPLVWHSLSEQNYNWSEKVTKMGYMFNDVYKQQAITSLTIAANDGGKAIGLAGTKIKILGVRA